MSEEAIEESLSSIQHGSSTGQSPFDAIEKNIVIHRDSQRLADWSLEGLVHGLLVIVMMAEYHWEIWAIDDSIFGMTLATRQDAIDDSQEGWDEGDLRG